MDDGMAPRMEIQTFLTDGGRGEQEGPAGAGERVAYGLDRGALGRA